jgi:hypothetical protein
MQPLNLLSEALLKRFEFATNGFKEVGGFKIRNCSPFFAIILVEIPIFEI